MKTVYLVFMSLSVFILTSVLFIKQNTALVFGDPSDFNTVTVSVDKTVNATDLTALVQAIQNIAPQQILKINTLSAEDQLRDMQTVLPSYSVGLFEDQEIAQILNPIIELQLAPETNSQDIIARIKTLKNINEIYFGNDWVNKIKNLFETLNVILNSIFILFFVILSFLVAVLIRNYLVDAKDNISLQALLGATPRQAFQQPYTSILIRTILAYVLGISGAILFALVIKEKLSVNSQLVFIGERLHFLNLTNASVIFLGLALNLIVSYVLSYYYVQREYYYHE